MTRRARRARSDPFPGAQRYPGLPSPSERLTQSVRVIDEGPWGQIEWFVPARSAAHPERAGLAHGRLLNQPESPESPRMTEAGHRSARVTASTAIDRRAWLALACAAAFVLLGHLVIPAAGWQGLLYPVLLLGIVLGAGIVKIREWVDEFQTWRRERQSRRAAGAQAADQSDESARRRATSATPDARGRPFDQHSPLWAALEHYHGAPPSVQPLIGPSIEAVAQQLDRTFAWRQVNILDRSLELWQTQQDPSSRQSLAGVWASAPQTREAIEAAELVLLDLEVRQAQVELELGAMAPLPSGHPVELTDWAAQRERTLIIDLFAPARLDADAATSTRTSEQGGD